MGVGAGVGTGGRVNVGASVGDGVGAIVGAIVGTAVVGDGVGDGVGSIVGSVVGTAVVGDAVGESVVGAIVGTSVAVAHGWPHSQMGTIDALHGAASTVNSLSETAPPNPVWNQKRPRSSISKAANRRSWVFAMHVGVITHVSTSRMPTSRSGKLMSYKMYTRPSSGL